MNMNMDMKAMLNNIKANTANMDLKMIDIDELHESADNFFTVDRVEELAESILAQGQVKENLIVTPSDTGYEIVSGHRRTAAVRYLLAKGENVARKLPCFVHRYNSEEDKLMDLIMMNVTQRQISDSDLYNSFLKLNEIFQNRKDKGEKFGKLREKIAEILNVSPAQVGKLQNVEKHAVPEIKEAVENGTISLSTANDIAKLDEEEQKEIAKSDNLAEIKPKDIKKPAKPKKVDTNINLANDDEEVDTCINLEEDGVDPTPEQLEQWRKEDAEKKEWANSLTEEQLDFLCDGGWYNDTIRGYVIAAARKADFSKEQIKELVNGLRFAFSEKNRRDVEKINEDFFMNY